MTHKPKSNQTLVLITAALVFGTLGVYYLRGTNAATAFLSAEPDAGTISAPAIKFADTTASSGSAVQFKAPAPTPPPPTPTPAPQPAALWTGDYEPGNFSQYQNASWNFVGASGPTIADGNIDATKVRQGRYAARFHVPAGGNRSEIVPLSGNVQEGVERYYGFSLYLDPSFPTNTGWQVLTQWKNDGDGSPPLEMSVQENAANFRFGGGYGHPSGPRMSGQSAGPVAKGVWIKWVVRIKFSSNPAIGNLDVWRDGTKVISNYYPTGGTLYPGMNSYHKLGIYRSTSITSAATLWNDSWRTGTSYEAVVPQ